MAMTISVIIPTLNEERTIMATLAQTVALGFDELIVVDGGSLDQTPLLVESYRLRTQHSVLSPVRLVPGPRGRARQMNEGAKVSRGDILLFLHADTQLPDDAKTVIETAMARPDLIGGRFDVRFDRPSRWGSIISSMMNWRSRVSGIATGDQALFVRRPIFEQMGGFADVPLMEDIDFSHRLKRRGATAALTTTVTTSFRRWEQQGPLPTILLMWALRFLYWIGVPPHTLNRWYGIVR
ncbi:MAG: TIGR04283 family arsenosugar biosynthesis glycosyltransferase [Nitrospirota bacterium]|nr:TIGR04283 family arsenosugar biosynthesis glycosyltransferase [Nitrospirota bacterium]MDP2382291.1 TIGR04283 family arsenosugar biosynthesis glycosyltransferase [Nitrospirota bacterium]MDP3597493.1 TIGR04283 family arsenosugar biosynthesis glycosyltransferase [Nitrospirota bacterium]